ncbi:MAG: exo-alpha-sialidase [Chloroflexi bacterium]|nr:exo-alpha-sialidase [Chloroflexota bacterium]
MTKKLVAEHGVVCRLQSEKLGYFGWPTVARLDDGALIVASSGLRSTHVCPWGKTVLNLSQDDGRTWSAPRVINDSPLDDRDAGIVALGGDRLLVSWFVTDNRPHLNDPHLRQLFGDAEAESWRPTLEALTDDIVDRHIGSWAMLSDNAGAAWSAPIRVPVSSPHGPIRLGNGELLYLGKPFGVMDDMRHAPITAARSTDGGHTWHLLGETPLCPGTVSGSYHEAHALELPSGKLIGAIRLENCPGENGDVTQAGLIHFSTLLTESTDGGYTWAMPRSLGYGSPPHLLQHSSGALILTYGYRAAGFGQRVGVSRDEGQSWQWDWIIRDDAPDWDLGYPSTVELTDGSLFTVYYQKFAAGEHCSLLWSRWQLP